MKSSRSERASTIVDAMTGVVLFSQGAAEMGQTNGSRALIVVALGGGAIILGGVIVRRRLGAQFRYFHAMVAFFEGLTCAFVGIASMQRGTNYIQFAWLLAAIAFLGAAVMHVRRTHRAAMPQVMAAGLSDVTDDVPVLLFEGPYAEVLFVQTLIESAGVETSSTDEMRGGRVGFEMRLFVRRADVEHARELVEDFRKNGHRNAY